MTSFDSKGVSSFFRFVNRPIGRVLRVAGGLTLFGVGYSQYDGTWALLPMVLMFFGAAAAATALLHLCPAALVVGGPISGKTILDRTQ